MSIRSSRALWVVLGALTLTLSGLLVWVGRSVLEQEARDRRSQQQIRREVAADQVVALLQRRLYDVRRVLDLILQGEPPAESTAGADAVIVRLESTLLTWPPDGLLYVPFLPHPSSEPGFEEVDRLEYARDYRSAVARLEAQQRPGTAGFNAARLVRLARNEAKARRLPQAERAWRALVALDATPVEDTGLPAALAGRLGLLDLFDAQSNAAAASEVAGELAVGAARARWRVTGDAFRDLADRLAAHGMAIPAPGPSLLLARSVEQFWERHLDDPAPLSGAEVSHTSDGNALLVWQRRGSAMALFAATPEFVTRQWLSLSPADVRLADRDTGGVFIGASSSVTPGSAVRDAATTGLPWHVAVLLSGQSEETGESLTRTFVISSIAIVLTMVVVGTATAGRAIARGVERARMQTDFVAGISHELRTPLTTLCQLSELLVRERVGSDRQRAEYYRLLQSESTRLRRLVDGLLSARRLEQRGRQALVLEELDVAALVRDTVDEIVRARLNSHHRIDLSVPSTAVWLQGDADHLRAVIWNLVDNAVKYSPQANHVNVSLQVEAGKVCLAVRDYGVGIRPDERRRIFDRFVRGSAAASTLARGAGLGLATARDAVVAHGGRIVVDGDGTGTTFTVVLPMEAPPLRLLPRLSSIRIWRASS